MNSLDAEVERQIDAWRSHIEKLPGRHVAIEALWDGDSDGWWLDVALVTAQAGAEGTFFTQSLGSLRYGGDIRLFQGTVPPWPEAEVARRAGKKVADLLGLEFYFPSPDEPDDDCPHWWERDHAIRCRTCGKQLVPQRSPHLAADQCRSCQLNEEHRQELIADAPGSSRSGLVWLIIEESGRAAHQLCLGLEFSEAGLVEHLATVLLNRRPGGWALTAHIDTVLTPAEAASMRAYCEAAIEERLAEYEPRTDLPDSSTHPSVFSWRGVKRIIQLAFNSVGEELATLFDGHALFDAGAGASSIQPTSLAPEPAEAQAETVPCSKRATWTAF